MLETLRLGVRPELWPEGCREILLAHSGRIWVVPSAYAVLEALSREGYQGKPLDVGLAPGDLLVVPVSPLEELVLLVDRLLGPGGCPWDQAQTNESLKRHLLEEAYEVLDAIDSGDPAKLREELGDLLLQPIMHGQIAQKDWEGDASASPLDTASIAAGIIDKLIRRHPHVFGDVQADDAEEVLRNWDQIKAAESGVPTSLLAGVPTGMASLLRAYEISKRAARAGFEWPDIDGVWEKLREEEAELREAISAADAGPIEAELGDLLFTVVNLARWNGVEPEEALRKMLNRFTERFQAMERMAERPLGELSLGEWDALWNRAKG